MKRLLSLFLAVMFVFGVPFQAFALPEGAQVAAGSAAFEQPDPSTLNIATSDRVIINYNSFNIAGGESVRFIQPSASSMALNRVVGLNPSELYGSLLANGRVFLINPNGIIFGAGSSIDTGSFLASTLDIADNDFLGSTYEFFQKEGKGPSYIVNKGNIRVGTGGFAVLVAPLVSNEGMISANLGKVAIGGASRATINFDGEGLIHFAIPDMTGEPGTVIMPEAHATELIKRIVAAPGMLEAGQVIEEGGVIKLVGAEGLVINSGTVRANDITIDSGSKGTSYISGTLDASGLGPGEKGGEVKALGKRVGLFGATVNASGSAGGGKVLIGGDFQGNGAVRNALRTYVSLDSTITADAIVDGDGGRVIVWSDGVTRYLGMISARGGSSFGNGGFVEVSGKGCLLFYGGVDLSATNGVGGVLLLDPNNITISTGADANTTGFDPDTTEAFAEDPGVDSNFDVTAVTGSFDFIGDGATIILQALIDITVSNDFNVGTATGASNVNLVLQAGNSITINAIITTTGTGTITLSADDNTPNGAGDIIFTASGQLHTTNSAITLTAVTLTIDSNAVIDSGNAAINVYTSQSSTIGLGSGAGTMSITSDELNTFGTTGTLTIGNANATTITVDTLDSTLAGLLSLTAGAGGGTITFSGAASSTADDLTLTSTTAVNLNVGLTVGGALTAATTTVNIADVTVQTTAGAIDLATGVTTVNLSGADATTTTISANGDGNTVSLATLADTNNPNLTVTSDGDITLAGGSLGTGTHTFTVDNDNDSIDTLTINGAFSGGAVTLEGGGTGTNDTIDLNADVTAASTLTIRDAQGTGGAAGVDLAQNVDLTANNGALTITSNINAIDLSGAGGTNIITSLGDALISLDVLTDTAAAGLTVTSDGGITLTTVTLDGGGAHTFTVDNDDDSTSTLTIGDTFQGGAVTFSGGGTGTADTIDINADTTAATTLTIQNAATVDLAAGVDLTTTNGALSATTNVTAINLSGANATTNIIDGNGDALVTLGAITDTNNPNLTINSEGAITLTSVAMGTGTLTIAVDNDGDTVSIGTFGVLTAGVIAATGVGSNDTLTFNGLVTSSTGATAINTAATINIGAGITAATTLDVNTATTVNATTGATIQTTNGELDISTGVTTLNITGGGTLTIDGNGDALVTLAALTDAAGENLTVNSEGDITLAAVTLNGGGAHAFTVDNDNDSTSTLTIGGVLQGGAVTFSGGGTGTNDTIDINADVTAATTLDIQNAAAVDLAAGVDLTTTNGALTATTNVTAINLSGADGTTNIIDGNGDALVTIAAITDTNNPNLTVNSEGGITLVSVAMGTGTLTLAVDNDGDSTSTGTFGALTAGIFTATGGADANDTLTFNGLVTSSTGATNINTAETVNINAGITAATTLDVNTATTVNAEAGTTIQTVNGELDIATGVTTLNITGASGTTLTIDGNGDALVTLAAITDTNNPNLTVNSEGSVTLVSVTMGAGTLTINIDNDNDTPGSAGTFGALTAGTIIINGADDANVTLNAAIVLNNADFSLTAGSITLAGVASINVGAGAVTLTARVGSIDSTSAAATDIIAGSLYLSAATGIGVTAALVTQVTYLQAGNSVRGDINIANTGNLTVYGTGIYNPVGSVLLTVASNLTLGGTVTGRYVELTASESILDDAEEIESIDVLSFGDARLQATAGMIGQPRNPLEVDIADELFLVVGGAVDNLSVIMNGMTVDRTVHLLQDTSGSVIFNNKLVFNSLIQPWNEAIAQLNPFIAQALPTFLTMNVFFTVDDLFLNPRPKPIQ